MCILNSQILPLIQKQYDTKRCQRGWMELQSETKSIYRLNTFQFRRGQVSSSSQPPSILNLTQLIQNQQIYSNLYTLTAQSQQMLLNKVLDNHPICMVVNKLFEKSRLFTNLAQHFADMFFKNGNQKAAGNWMFLFGVGYLTWKTIQFIYRQYKIFGWLPQHLKNKKSFTEQKFYKRYGSQHKTQKVLITGGADGIGLAFCKKFAKMGFNLIITDLNQEKLRRRKRQLEERYKIEVAYRALNMSSPSEMNNFLQEIGGDFGSDIRIVVNNVGMSAGGQYLKIDPEKMKAQIYLNFQTMYEINKVMLPKLRNLALGDGQNKKSAIINIASGTGVFYSPVIGAYSALKHLTDIYSRTLTKENRDQVDIISVRPFGVITNMMHMSKKERMITPKQCVDAVIEDLFGKCDTTFSGVPHKILAGFFSTKGESQYIPMYVNAFNRKNDKK